MDSENHITQRMGGGLQSRGYRGSGAALLGALFVSRCLARKKHSLGSQRSGDLSQQGQPGSHHSAEGSWWRIPLAAAAPCAPQALPARAGLWPSPCQCQTLDPTPPAAIERGAGSTDSHHPKASCALPPMRKGHGHHGHQGQREHTPAVLSN